MAGLTSMILPASSEPADASVQELASPAPPADAAQPRRPRLLLRGVSAGSPLALGAILRLASLAEITCEPAPDPPASNWRRAVRGTALQWFVDTLAASHPDVGTPDITLDLHRMAAGDANRSWCIVDPAGTPLLRNFHGLDRLYRAPYVASLNLIESTDAGRSWELLAAAHVSSATTYEDLLDVLGRAAVLLLQTGLRGAPMERTQWRRLPPPAPASRTALLRARIAAGMDWLRARLGGELYGIAKFNQPLDSLVGEKVVSAGPWLGIASSQGFLADPFPWPGRPGVVLCEAYAHRTGRGSLLSLTLDGGRIASTTPVPVGADCHLSYPFAFFEQGRVFCLPEMAACRRQMLFELRADAPPRAVCVIAEGVGMADPTIMKIDGRYWLAYTDVDIGVYDNLCFLHAERLEGPWKPHPGNPVKIDVRSSRSAGTPFLVGDRLFRPAQDCSRSYGGALVINQVKTCTLDAYQEEQVCVLRPDPNGPYPDGLHTLSCSDGMTLIDGKRFSYHPMILFHKLRRRLPRARRSS